MPAPDFANFQAADRKRNLVNFGLFPQAYDLSWIRDNSGAQLVTLTPTPDGATTDFTFSMPAGFVGATITLFRNGLLQELGIHYTISGKTILFIPPYQPLVDDYFQAFAT